jgi:YidC/Oxa1 family membrane protein insertase
MGQDKKRLILVMLLSLVVLYGWDLFMRWQWPEWYAQRGKPPQQQQQPETTNPTTTPTTAAATTTAGATTHPWATQPAWHARGDEAGKGNGAAFTSLGSGAHDDPKFTMAVDLARRGAAINAVTLNQFKKTADDPARYVFQEPYHVGGSVREDSRALLTRSIVVDGQTIDVSHVAWRLESADGSSARYSLDVVNGETPVVKVIKTYKLAPRSDDPKTPQGYEVNVGHRFENLTDRPVNVKMVLNGPTAPPRELESQPDQNIIAGYWNEGSVKVFSHLLAGEFAKDRNFHEYTKDEKGREAVWSGMQSAYFNAIILPAPLDPKKPAAEWVWKVYGETINPSEEKAEERHVALRLETGGVDVPAKGAQQLDINAYFGPKARKVLNTDYYTALPRAYNETLVISGGWCAICTFQWLINILVAMLTAFHFVTRDWGLAIICLVLVVRALLHPITKRSQIHMVKMQKMGPEMEKLKKKYADDKEALAKAQMQFYKEQGFTPILGCLPMFLQMPIWIALWNSLQSTFELRHSPFLWGFTWIHDLAKPDYLVKFSQAIPLIFGWQLKGINILPILMGVVFFLQTKLQPKPAAMTPEQEQQQKMMTWMSTLLFPLMLYSGPSGLNLYILTSTAFGIMESKVIRDHIKQRELLEGQGPTIIDAPPPGKPGKSGKDDTTKKKGWLERLQDMAEQAKTDAAKRGGKRP